MERFSTPNLRAKHAIQSPDKSLVGKDFTICDIQKCKERFLKSSLYQYYSCFWVVELYNTVFTLPCLKSGCIMDIQQSPCVLFSSDLCCSRSVILGPRPVLLLVSTGYTGHWSHQFGDGSSQCLLCPGTDQHTVQKQAFLTAVIFTEGSCPPTFMWLW